VLRIGKCTHDFVADRFNNAALVALNSGLHGFEVMHNSLMRLNVSQGGVQLHTTRDIGEQDRHFPGSIFTHWHFTIV